MTRDDLVSRHAELLGKLEKPEIPAELSSRSFLDGIYERAARDMAEDLDSEVAESLSTRFEAPAELERQPVDPERFEPSPLRELESVEAPGLMWPRLRADLRSWTAARRRHRTQRRVASSLAAAALVFLAVWTFDGFREEDTVVDPEPRISIVRHRMTSPIAPGFSSGSIVREITGTAGTFAGTAGTFAGSAGVLAAPPSAPDFPANRVGGRRAR